MAAIASKRDGDGVGTTTSQSDGDGVTARRRDDRTAVVSEGEVAASPPASGHDEPTPAVSERNESTRAGQDGEEVGYVLRMQDN